MCLSFRRPASTAQSEISRSNTEKLASDPCVDLPLFPVVCSFSSEGRSSSLAFLFSCNYSCHSLVFLLHRCRRRSHLACLLNRCRRRSYLACLLNRCRRRSQLACLLDHCQRSSFAFLLGDGLYAKTNKVL